MVDAGEAEPR